MVEGRDHLRLVKGGGSKHEDLFKILDKPPQLGKLITNEGARVRNGIASIHKRLFDPSIPLPAPFKKTTYRYEPSHDIFDRSIGVGTVVSDHFMNRTLHVRYGVHVLARLLEHKRGLNSTVADHYALTHVAVGDIIKSPNIMDAMNVISDDSKYSRHVALWRLAGGLAGNELMSEPTQEKLLAHYESVGASVLRDLNIGIEIMQSNASLQEKVLPEYLAVIPAPVVGLLSPLMPSTELEEVLGHDIVRGTSG